MSTTPGPQRDRFVGVPRRDATEPSEASLDELRAERLSAPPDAVAGYLDRAREHLTGAQLVADRGLPGPALASLVDAGRAALLAEAARRGVVLVLTGRERESDLAAALRAATPPELLARFDAIVGDRRRRRARPRSCTRG